MGITTAGPTERRETEMGQHEEDVQGKEGPQERRWRYTPQQPQQGGVNCREEQKNKDVEMGVPPDDPRLPRAQRALGKNEGHESMTYGQVL